MMKFYCDTCRNIFENEGNKIEYHSVTYGPCFKYTAICPDCGSECNEFRPAAKKQTSSSEFSNCSSGHCSCCK